MCLLYLRRIYGDCARPFAKLAFSCGGRYDIASTTTDTQRFFAADQNVVYPYGVDPVFLRCVQAIESPRRCCIAACNLRLP